MSRFSGRQYPGAMRDHKNRLRDDAMARDAALPQDSLRRRRNKAFSPAHRLLKELFGKGADA